MALQRRASAIQAMGDAPANARSERAAALDRDARSDDVAALAARLPLRPRIPVATYRLQFGPAFGFRDARRIVPYLHELGISDCYASPYLKARPESTHGYDVADHNALNPAFGSEEDFDQWVATLQAHGMGQIMDVVPNHMGIGSSANRAWMDVLENGPGSAYASFFDIDWNPLMVGPELQNKVLLPILGDPYGKVLESQELRLSYEQGSFFVNYYDSKLPITPISQTDLLSYALPQLTGLLSAGDELLLEYQSIITGLSHLPPPTETAPEKIAEREREKEVIRRRLDALCRRSAEVRAAIEDTIRVYNGVKGEANSFDRLDALLAKQCYRIAYWRVAADEINYRRFFDINDLAALRMENPAVFAQTHQLVLQLAAEGKVTGLRIDHPDGLWDPEGYFRQLQRGYFLRLCRRYLGEEEGAGEWAAREARLATWFERQGSQLGGPPLYVVAEKILSPGERLPEQWPVYGTTGYDFANAVNGIFVARQNRKAFDHIYSGFTGLHADFGNLVNSTKKMIMLISLASETNMLGYQLKRIAARNRWYRDFTLAALTFAVREVIAALPVYRTYIDEERSAIDRQSRGYIEAALAEAKRRNPRTAPTLFDFIGDILLQRYPYGGDEEDRRGRATFIRKFQQTSGPVMAKGVEDTAFYVYNRLLSLNEVGGSPAQFGIPVGAFHRQNAARLRQSPHSLLATSTHDTKRSEDVRARINVLSEIPAEWKAALARWSRLNRDKKRLVDGHPAPDANEEYLLYQTLLGVWPLDGLQATEREDFSARIAAYMLKAVKEAKVNTSWINPNEAYDAAVQDFVRAILDDRGDDRFRQDFEGLRRKVAHYGIYNSLAQTLLKIAAPGVPDFYQGSELWDFSLVDPDNRRPVDFALRMKMLATLQGQVAQAGDDRTGLVTRLLRSKSNGMIKLYVTYLGLSFRRAHETLFREGQYVPLRAGGGRRDHVCAFARVRGREAALVIVPRLLVALTGDSFSEPLGPAVWGNTWVGTPGGKAGRCYRNVFSGERVKTAALNGHQVLPLATVFASFPVALLEAES